MIIESDIVDEDEATEPMGAQDTGDPAELVEWKVSQEEHAARLDRVLVGRLAGFSRSHLQGLIERGAVTLGGAVESAPGRKLRVGQTVQVRLEPAPHTQAFTPEAMSLPIVYEDEDLLVIDKPAGLVVHPASGHWSGTLLNGLLAHHPDARHLPRAGIVHRLDKDTSGLMVVAKRLEAHTALVEALGRREIRRVYHALVWGAVPPGPFDVEAPIARDPRNRLRMAVVPNGKPSRTTVTRQGIPFQGISAVECALHTGRTHQIRVHLRHLGHPLVGDETYGGKPWGGIERQALHAVCLAFAHPITEKPCQWTSAPPPPMIDGWNHVVDASGPATRR